MNQKVLLFTLLMFTFVCNVDAESISVADVSLIPGSQSEIVINCEFDAADITLYQFDLYLPEGVTPAYDEEEEDYVYTLSGRHKKSHTFAMQNNGSYYRVVVSSSANKLIAAGDGELLRLTVDVDPSVSGTMMAAVKAFSLFAIDEKEHAMGDVTFKMIADSIVMATGVSLSQSSLTLTSGGQTATLTATVIPSNATNKNVTWSSSNESVAIVSSEGVVTSVYSGRATITVTTTDGSNKTATCEVTSIASEGDINIENIYYILDTYSKTATVTKSSESYRGNIVIPGSVNYGGEDYVVKYIGDNAFSGCSGITSIEIPSSIIIIGDNVFSGCSGLKKVTLNSNFLVSKDYTYSPGLKDVFGTQVEEYVLGDEITDIGPWAFEECSSMIGITIGSSVKSIGDGGFSGCDNLNRVIVNSNFIVSKDYTISSNLKNIFGAQVKEYVLGSKVAEIGAYAFYNCKNMKSITISNPDVGFRDGKIFYGCENATIYTPKGGNVVLSLWECLNDNMKICDMSTGLVIEKPLLLVESTTQTTATFKLENYEDNYRYKIGDVVVTNRNCMILTDLQPENSYSVVLSGRCKDREDWHNIDSCSYQTAELSATVAIRNITASSVTVMPTYIKGDANVTEMKVILNGDEIEEVEDGKTYTFTGLNPDKPYSIGCSIVANGYTFSSSNTIRTQVLRMETLQPRVISIGNVIVAAETNLDEEETNVGFLWRRIDWTDEFYSNTGVAYIYGDMMEGYIRNLNTDKIWKYRPFYKTKDGDTYYGEWVGIDPTDTSYFEPTVHTYSTIDVQGNRANVKGYAMRGTDNVVQQGFKFWKTSNLTRDLEGVNLMTMNIPAGAQTVTASGQVMMATLSDLDYETDYMYVAFLTTSEGETFYGEQQAFRTGEDVTGIRNTFTDDTSPCIRIVVGYYNVYGQRLCEPQRGVNIVCYSDGTSRKIIVK